MINNLDGKSARELREIVQIQIDEYQKLQQANDEAQLLIGLLDAEVEKLKYEWYRRTSSSKPRVLCALWLAKS